MEELTGANSFSQSTLTSSVLLKVSLTLYQTQHLSLADPRSVWVDLLELLQRKRDGVGVEVDGFAKRKVARESSGVDGSQMDSKETVASGAVVAWREEGGESERGERREGELELNIAPPSSCFN